MSLRALRAVGTASALLALLWLGPAGCPHERGAPTDRATPDPLAPSAPADNPGTPSDPNTAPAAEPAPLCAAVLTGDVLMEATREPMAGVTVSCAGMSTTTDQTGHYALAGVACGTQVLCLSAAHFHDATLDVEITADDVAVPPVTMQSLYGPAEVSGAVRDAVGHVVAAARVAIGACTSESDADGSYSLCGVPVGAHTISATHDRYDAFHAAVAVSPDMPIADVNITLLGTTLPPPTGLVCAAGWREVSLVWDAVTAPPARRYRVFAAALTERGDGPLELLAEPSSASFVHAGVRPDARFRYCVSAVFADGVEGPRCGAVLASAQSAAETLATLADAASGLNFAAGRLWWLARLPAGEMRLRSLDVSDPNAIDDRPAWELAGPAAGPAAVAVADSPEIVFAATGPSCESLMRRTWSGAAYSDATPITSVPNGCVIAMDCRDGELFLLQALGGQYAIRWGTVDTAGGWTPSGSVDLGSERELFGLAIDDSGTAWVISQCGYWSPPPSPPPCCTPVGPVLPHPVYITGVPVCRALLQIDLSSGAVLREVPVTRGGEPTYAASVACDASGGYIAVRDVPPRIDRVRTDP